VISSKAFMEYEEFALLQLKSCNKHFIGHIEVEYIFYLKGKMGGDIDNLIASINDILQKAEIIDDDKNIICLRGSKIANCSEWKTEVVIKSIPDP
jgi:Holliday junction resolvase RusA-like endonuclease